MKIHDGVAAARPDTEDSPRSRVLAPMFAVCRLGAQLQELGVHPQVSIEALQKLLPWEFVCVHEGVVINVWNDDDTLFTAQFGDVVSFEGYANRERFQVRVSRPGREEAIVTLATPLRGAVLQRGTKLVLQRDDPRWAIEALPAEQAESKFEVPLERLNKRLEDLAGLDELSERILEDILMRIAFTDIRDTFDLSPLRGALLISYQPGMGKTAFCEALAVWLRAHEEMQDEERLRDLPMRVVLSGGQNHLVFRKGTAWLNRHVNRKRARRNQLITGVALRPHGAGVVTLVGEVGHGATPCREDSIPGGARVPPGAGAPPLRAAGQRGHRPPADRRRARASAGSDAPALRRGAAVAAQAERPASCGAPRCSCNRARS